MNSNQHIKENEPLVDHCVVLCSLCKICCILFPHVSSILCIRLTFIIYFPHHVYFERQSRINYAAIYELIYRRRQHLYDNKQEGMITSCLIKLDDAASGRIILFTMLMEAFYINYINGKIRTISIFIFS